MKKILLLIVISLLCFSCEKVKRDEKYKSKPKDKSELFKEAKDLKGIGKLIIGKTTIADLDLINDEIKGDDRYSYLQKNGFKPNELMSQIECLEMFFNGEYYIGDLKLSSVYLYFYDGVLYEIKCSPSESLEKAFTEKYGEGVRETEVFASDKRTINNKYVTWENELIKARIFSMFEADKNDISLFIDNFYITNKSDSVSNSIKECQAKLKQERKEAKDQEWSDTLDQL